MARNIQSIRLNDIDSSFQPLQYHVDGINNGFDDGKLSHLKPIPGFFEVGDVHMFDLDGRTYEIRLIQNIRGKILQVTSFRSIHNVHENAIEEQRTFGIHIANTQREHDKIYVPKKNHPLTERTANVEYPTQDVNALKHLLSREVYNNFHSNR